MRPKRPERLLATNQSHVEVVRAERDAIEDDATREPRTVVAQERVLGGVRVIDVAVRTQALVHVAMLALVALRDRLLVPERRDHVVGECRVAGSGGEPLQDGLEGAPLPRNRDGNGRCHHYRRVGSRVNRLRFPLETTTQ